MANVLYFLTANPDKYERLQKDIDEASQAGDYKSHLPYLEAIVAETLRLKPVVPGGQPRETPPEGLFIDEVWIPGKINILVPQWVIQRDERNYERPLEFLPERWMEEGKHLTVNDQAYFPFSIGEVSWSDSTRGYLLTFET